MHAAELADLLTARLFRVKQTGAEWRCQCPAHGGEGLNLAIRDGAEAVICTCHSHHCTAAAVAAALGLEVGELWFTPRVKENGDRPEPHAYPYRDEAGQALYEMVRIEAHGGQKKQFLMRLPGAQRYGVGNVRRVLFGLPELLATAPGDLVAIAEGEKCAVRVAEQGIAATTNPNGAGTWKPEYTAWLQQHLPDRRFLVLADNDPEGKAHALAVCDSLKAAGLRVWLANLGELPPKGDVVDWLAKGGTAAQLAAMAQDAPPKLWAKLLTFDQLLVQPPPIWLVEDLFFEETLVEIYSPPNKGKTFITADLGLAIRGGQPWCGRRILRPGPVVYVNADGGKGFSSRARDWAEIHGGEAAPHEFYTLQESLNLHNPAAVQELMDAMAFMPEPPVLAVFDTYSRCIPGVNENLQEFASMVVEHLNQLTRAFHCTVLLVHHTDLSGSHARGSSVILGACDTQMSVEKTEDDVITLTCEKQRDWSFFEPLYFDLGRIEGTNATWITQRAEPPSRNQTEQKEANLRRCTEAIERDPGITREQLGLGLELSLASCKRYAAELIARGEVFQRAMGVTGPGGGHVPLGLFPVPIGLRK